MSRILILAILIAAVCAGPIGNETTSPSLNVDVVDNIQEYLVKNPDFEILAEMKGEFMKNRQQFRYSHGRRIQGKCCVETVRLTKPSQILLIHLQEIVWWPTTTPTKNSRLNKMWRLD